MAKYTDELLDEKFASINCTIKEIKNDTKEIRSICIAIEKIANETRALREDFNNVNARLSDIEKRPGEMWKYVISIVVGAVVTFALTKIGIK